MSTVLVAVPAHDEEAEIAGCLEHVGDAVHHALAGDDPPRVAVLVAAHRCADRTAAVAARVLGERAIPGCVVRDNDSVGVGAVRRRLVARGLRMSRGEPAQTWLFNTDADSWVPSTWITETLRRASEASVAAVAGMVELREWRASPWLRARYAGLLAEERHGATHTHVYGANLAVRLDAYLRVGGFRAVHGEDQDLVDRLLAAGEPVAGAFSPVVTTSARAPGRASGGLGALLARLADEEDAAAALA